MRKPILEDVEYIYRASIKLRNGKILYARDCGLKAFKIPVRAKPKQEEKPNGK